MSRYTVINKRVFFAISLYMFLCPFSYLFAEGSSGLYHLRMPVFARASGMGGAYAAIAEGPAAISYNPGGLFFQESEYHYYSAGHVEWMDGMRKESIVMIFPENFMPRLLVRAVSIEYFTIDGLERFDDNGASAGTIPYDDKLVSFSFGRKFSDYFVAGGNVKYLSESIAEYSGSGYAMDFGFLSAISSSFRFGISLSNIGKFTFDGRNVVLPQTFRTGIGIFGADDLFVIDVDWEKVNSSNIFHIGGELNKKSYLLRSGWKYSEFGNEYSVGIGWVSDPPEVSVWNAQLVIDYALIGSDYYESLNHRIDFGIKF